MICVKMGGAQTSKNRSVDRLGSALGGSWGNLGASWALLEAFWACWGGLGDILGVTWGILEVLWSLLKTFWVHHGASWESLGRVLGGLGAFQGRFWKHSWRISVHLKQFMKIVKNLGKTLIFKVLEGFRLPKITKKSQKDRSWHLKRPKNSQDGDLGGQECDFTAQVGAKRAILEPKNDGGSRKISKDYLEC